ncbi:MAG: hypothetical protein JRJ02_12705 [Deltaproteobacteria bacterium]|nr:hypothetical protein [Deltaproteobacteria bacterium]
MPKQIILYNLRDDVKEEVYIKWCEDYKGPLLLGMKSGKSFTLLRMLGGVKGDGQKGIPPEETKSPYRFMGIMDVTSLEDWKKETGASKAFSEEFNPQWFTKWVGDFYGLGGEEVYHGESE